MAELAKLKKIQTVRRTALTRAINSFKNITESAGLVEKHEIEASLLILSDKMAELEKASSSVIDAMINSETDTEAEVQIEIDKLDKYKSEYLVLKLSNQVSQSPVTNETTTPTVIVKNEKNNFKLPELELVKFSGNARDWLQFWSQHKKFHDNENLDEEIKFRYLIQQMTPGSKAQQLVLSYPPTKENYKNAITSLKNRYGRDELQVEVYVRELLNLVLQNAIATQKLPLSTLYDKLESHMRSLDSIGVTAEKCAPMLFPLVESCLPEEVIRVWQRTQSSEAAASNQSGDRLKSLLSFLQTEVENEEKVCMAINGFHVDSETKEPNNKAKNKKLKSKTENSNDEIATAIDLLHVKPEKRNSCIFCKEAHENSGCAKAKKMALDEKRQMVKDCKVCFYCLKPGHSYTRCKVNVKCAWCSRRHTIVMCPDLDKASTSKVLETADGKKEHNLANLNSRTDVLLPTLRAHIYNEERQILVRIVIDTGCQRSYVRSDIAQSLQYVPIKTHAVKHGLFGDVTSETQNHKVYRIRVKSLTDDYRCNFEVLDQKKICGDIPSVHNNSWVKRLEKEGIFLTDTDGKVTSVDVLIGADIAGKLLAGRIKHFDNGMTAIETHLGWTMVGDNKENTNSNREDTSLLLTSLFVREANISDLWNLDVLGIEDPTKKIAKQTAEIQVRKFFEESVNRLADGRYEVALPWIEDHAPLPDNRQMAEKRLESVMTRLKRDNLFDAYDAVFKEWWEDDVVELVPEDEIENLGHYLPHRPVVKEESTTKIRPVFDASAKMSQCPSLNDCLQKGPNLIELIPASLLDFRKEAIGVIADIKRAFLQISVRTADRDYLRFLWLQDGVIRVFRHKRVVFGLNCSPFLLAAPIDYHLRHFIMNQSPNSNLDVIAKKLVKSFYVDNCVPSVKSQDELKCFIEKATNIMAEARFELRGWEYSQDGDDKKSKVLGLIWDKQTDVLSINPSALKDLVPEKVTKRTILQRANRVFDPIGFTTPMMLTPKLLLQETCFHGFNWDEDVNNRTKIKFDKWVKNLHNVKLVKIERTISPILEEASSIHVFCDASQLAYACVIYLRTVTSDGIKLHLLAAKSRIAPALDVTIPRLELLAANIGARLGKSVVQALGSNLPVHYWTDSTTVLSWIQRECQWNIFVFNRVKEIRELSNKGSWRHIPGECNPADLPSRGCNVNQLEHSRWWEGPSWLREEESAWPVSEERVDEAKVMQEEKKTKILTLLAEHKQTGNSDNWYTNRFSSYRSILRLVAWTKRFGYNCKCSSTTKRSGNLSFEEIIEAENFVILRAQNEMFAGIGDKKISSLNPFVDERGIIRIKTRIFNRDDKFEFRCPIVLKPDHIITQRMLQEKHRDMHHVGVQIMLGTIREKFWILRARKTLNQLVHGCSICQRHSAKRMQLESPPLPIDRVRDADVFEVTGIDLAGPLYLKTQEKAWICLFTCAVYRAVHFELLSSLSSQEFLEALRRFVARRGRPSIIYTDNGTNFEGAENLFSKLNWEKIASYSKAKKIEWRFIPPAAPWWGGWWERLVGVTKQILRKTLGKARVTLTEMVTILCDIESLINSRPLTYVSEDVNDLAPLTPAMFLHGIKEVGVPDIDSIKRTNLVVRYKYKQSLIDNLRERFRSEYLSQLVGKKRPVIETRKIRVGDLVLVEDHSKKRLMWPLARVTKTFENKNSKTSVVRLKTANGEMTRPVQRIFPLELDMSDSVDIREKPTVEVSRDEETLEKEISFKAGDRKLQTKKRVGKIDGEKTVITRSGRQSQKPERLIY